MLLRLFVLVSVTGILLQAQPTAPGNCRSVSVAAQDKTSVDKLMDALSPVGAGATVYAVISENGRLALFGAAATAVNALYGYLKPGDTVPVCIAPKSFNGLGAPSVTFLGSGAAMKPYIGSSHSLSTPALDLLSNKYEKLAGIDPGLLVHARAAPRATTLNSKLFSETLQIHTDTNSSKVRGIVADAVGRRLPDVTVEILPVDNRTAWVHELTNWDGIFESIQPAGKYLIYAHVDGYRDFTTTFVKTWGTDAPMTIQMSPLPRR